MAFFWEQPRFGFLFKASPAVHYIFFGDFAPAQSPKKDAVSIGAMIKVSLNTIKNKNR